MTKVTTDPGIGAVAPEPHEPSTPAFGETVRQPLPGALDPKPTARYRTDPNAELVTEEHEIFRRVKPAKKAGIKGLREDPLADAQRADVRLVHRDAGLQEIEQEIERDKTEAARAKAESDGRRRLLFLAVGSLLVGLLVIFAIRATRTIDPVPPAPTVASPVVPPAVPKDPVAPVAPADTTAASAQPSPPAPASATVASPSTTAKTPKVPHNSAIGPSTSEAPTVVPVPAPPPSVTVAPLPPSAPSAAKNPEIPPFTF